MPVYEFVCKRCARPFEELLFGDERPVCPNCKSTDAHKQYSVFGTAGGETSARADAGYDSSCGTCGDPRGPGACSLN